MHYACIMVSTKREKLTSQTIKNMKNTLFETENTKRSPELAALAQRMIGEFNRRTSERGLELGCWVSDKGVILGTGDEVKMSYRDWSDSFDMV